MCDSLATNPLKKGYIWVNDMLILGEQGFTLEFGHLIEDPCEVKVSPKVLSLESVRATYLAHFSNDYKYSEAINLYPVRILK